MFWRQTPRLLCLAINGRQRAEKTAHQHRAWLAWHSAFLTHMDRPNFRELAGLKPPAPSRQSPAQIMAVMSQWRAVTTQRPSRRASR